MKTIKYIMLAIAFAFIGVQLQAEETKPSVKQEVKDEFMRFALDKAKQYTGTAGQVVGKTVDLVQKEAPETVEQFLKWRFIKHLLSFLIPISLTIIGVVGFVAVFWIDATVKDDITAAAIPFAFLSIIGGMFSLFMLPELFSAIQIYVAPRIYLIEELGKLLK